MSTLGYEPAGLGRCKVLPLKATFNVGFIGMPNASFPLAISPRPCCRRLLARMRARLFAPDSG
jgi:hypothetical protein